MKSALCILIISPLLIPEVTRLGIDPVHFGIIIVISVAFGFLTPPVGVNLFVACGISKLSIETVTLAVLPFLGVMIIGLVLIAFFPALSLCLL